jgi:peroxiredoxin
MSKGLVPGAVLPDFVLPDTTGSTRRLSELQGDNPMILMLGRSKLATRSLRREV